MNIFKVFASAKKGFQEEYASAILAWPLNPTLEHGLGFAFLAEFVGSLAGSHPSLDALLPRLVPCLRTDSESALPWGLHMEFFVAGAFVDVVVVLDDWVLAVEDKIFPTSVQDGQLKREYEGLRQKYPTDKRIAMLYLVPVDEGGPLHPKIEKEFNDLAVQPPDFKRLLTWQARGLQLGGQSVPSVEAMLKAILAKEAACEVTPINEYTRHTLKALCRFIADDFCGYDFEKPEAGTGLNPLTEEQLTVSEMAAKTEGYAGVQHGVAGLLRTLPAQLADHKFQYSRSEMSGRNGWMPVGVFNGLAKWLQTATPQPIQWDFELPSKLLARIAAAYGNQVYIGIRGGRANLEAMPNDKIDKKSWRISSTPGNAEWIDGNTFLAVLRSKGFTV